LSAGGNIQPPQQPTTQEDLQPVEVSDLPYANESSNSIFDFKNGTLSGEFQAQYRYRDTDTQNNLFTTSGNLKYLTSEESLLQAGINFYGITQFGMFDNEDRIPMFLQNDGSGFSILNEAFLGLNHDYGYGKVFAKGGRFHMNEKLINSQDHTMYDYPVPNSFEGALIGTKLDMGLSFEGAWISRMSGQDNGVDASEFKNIETVASGYEGVAATEDSD
jgi:hypothetical protein